MIIIPAIDIKDAKVVRLHQGKFDRLTEYSSDPLAMAQKWQEQGAQRLHLVDLDGALTGQMQNFKMVAKIAKSVKIPVQVGGGIRTTEDILRLLESGVANVILGTKAVENKDFLKQTLKKWKKNIIVSLDCNKGMVAQRGWTTTSDIKGTDLARELEGAGLQCLIHTDIAKDGTLSGPNFKELEEILNVVKIPVIASGGISGIDDIKKLCRVKPKGLLGVITGKAIYDGRLDLKEAISYAQQKDHTLS
jgi:phosphoribosylformimino-5-aminoimidazole carboxamide ribotide isomerase